MTIYPPRSHRAYFGEPWPSGVCDDGYRTETPERELCQFCEEPIQPTDRGSFVGTPYSGLQPIHRECSLREVLGGIGHLRDHLYWCKDQRDPDGGMTRRQSAIEVWAWVQEHGLKSV